MTGQIDMHWVVPLTCDDAGDRVDRYLDQLGPGGAVIVVDKGCVSDLESPLNGELIFVVGIFFEDGSCCSLAVESSHAEAKRTADRLLIEQEADLVLDLVEVLH